MECEHQVRGARRVHGPLTDHGRGRAGDEEGPRETDDPFAGRNAASRGFTSGQHDESCGELKTGELPGLQDTVLPVGFGRGSQEHVRVHRARIVQDAMGGEMEHLEARRLLLQTVFARVWADIYAAGGRAVETPEHSNFSAGFGQRGHRVVSKTGP